MILSGFVTGQIFSSYFNIYNVFAIARTIYSMTIHNKVWSEKSTTLHIKKICGNCLRFPCMFTDKNHLEQVRCVLIDVRGATELRAHSEEDDPVHNSLTPTWIHWFPPKFIQKFYLACDWWWGDLSQWWGMLVDGLQAAHVDTETNDGIMKPWEIHRKEKIVADAPA